MGQPMDFYKIIQYNEDGTEVIKVHGYQWAGSPGDARKKAAIYSDNKEIETTGFYDALKIDREAEFKRLNDEINIAKLFLEQLQIP